MQVNSDGWSPYIKKEQVKQFVAADLAIAGGFTSNNQKNLTDALTGVKNLKIEKENAQNKEIIDTLKNNVNFFETQFSEASTGYNNAKANYDNTLNNPNATAEQKAKAKQEFEDAKKTLDIAQNNIDETKKYNAIYSERVKSGKEAAPANEAMITSNKASYINQLEAGLNQINQGNQENTLAQNSVFSFKQNS